MDDLTPPHWGSTMTLDEALEAAVLGEKVRAVDMQAGTYIDYHFNGWRINTATGSSSFYNIKEHDKTVDWEIFVPPVVNVGWGDFKPPKPTTFMQEVQQVGRASRKPGRKPVVYEFVGEPVPLLNQKPTLADELEAKEKAMRELGAKLINPWAEAGLTDDKPAATGWAVFNKE